METSNLLWNSLPLLLQGVKITLQLFFLSGAVSFFLGLLFGILSSERLGAPLLSPAIKGITFALRAVPFYVQLLIVYFVLPDLIALKISPFAASVLSLGICSAGYVSQFIRGIIDSLPIAYSESAFSLGYSKWQTLWKVLLPETLRLSLPPFNNELESLLKSTSIASSVGMLELTRIGMNIASREMEPVPIFLSIALLYGTLSTLLGLATKQLEKRCFNGTNQIS